MLRIKLILLFLIMLLIAKFRFGKKENFSQCPSPNCSEDSPCPSPNCSEDSPCSSGDCSENNDKKDNTSTDKKDNTSTNTTNDNSPTPSPDSRNITGVEIIFQCDGCSIDSFTEEEKRDIINGILNKFTELNIENVEFKRGFVRVLIFLDLDEIDEEYIRNMVKTIKKDKIEMFINKFKLETFDSKILYEHDEDYKINKRSGCHSSGRNNRNNMNNFMKILKEGGEKNVILQFKPCGPANIFAPHIEIGRGT
jgi:hypothetical protein